jgi:hypothetical protein
MFFIELAELNNEFTADAWLDVGTWFGISHEIDMYAIEIAQLRYAIQSDAEKKGIYDYKVISGVDGDVNKTFAVVFIDAKEEAKQLWMGKDWLRYTELVNNLGKILNVKYNIFRLVPKYVPGTIDLTFEDCLELWQKSVEVTESSIDSE